MQSISSARLDSILDRVLLILVGLPMLLLLSLIMIFLALVQAQAAEDPACGGIDLVEKLKQDNPEEYRKFMALADTIENGQSTFWKIEKDGVTASYLLGTFHVTDPRVTDLPAVSRAPFDQSSTLIVESDEILDQQAAAARLMAIPDLMMFPGKQTIKDFLTPEEQKLLEEGMIKRGIPFLSVVKMKPWLISSMLALSSCELSRKASGKPFLDMKLALDAKAAGKPVKGLETLAEQIQAMADLPMKLHVMSLVSVVRYQSFVVDIMETSTQLYLDGHASLIMPAAAFFNPDKNPSDVADMAQFEQRLIVDRNHVMAERAAPILAEGNVFMAVGAAHLSGPEGLVALLRKQGYVLTALP